MSRWAPDPFITEAKFLQRVSPEPNSGCWLWMGKADRKGYGRVEIEGGCTGAHRWSWLHFRGPIPGGICVLHRCDNPSCVNPDHLWLGTTGDNNRDCFSKRRDGHTVKPERNARQPGESKGYSKLTNDAVRVIRQRAANGETGNTIADSIGMSRQNVYRILARKTWTHL